MTDTLFADISSYQASSDDRYPYHFISFRSNDGTYRDPRFAANLQWAKTRTASGRLVGFMVYFVWEPNWQQTLATFRAMVGVPDARMAVMIDVESWSGRIRGDHSTEILASREAVIAWLDSYRNWFQRVWAKLIGQSNRKKVGVYGNSGDLAAIMPRRGDAWVGYANYSSNPAFPGKLFHQFSSTFYVPPFGPCDINSADGYTPERFAAALGFGHVAPPAPPSTPPPAPQEEMDMATVYVNQDNQALKLLDTGSLVIILKDNGSGGGAPVVQLADPDYKALRALAVNATPPVQGATS